MRAFDEAVQLLPDLAKASLKHIDTEDVHSLVEYLRSARHIVIFGRGRSGLVARTFAVRLGHLGFRAFVVGETSTPPVSDEDLVVLVSGSGQTFSVTLTAQIARDLGARVVALTATPDSRLAELADVVLVLDGHAGSATGGVAPLGTVFEFAAHLFFDALVAVLMSELGETEASMQARHATLE